MTGLMFGWLLGRLLLQWEAVTSDGPHLISTAAQPDVQTLTA